MGLQVRGNSQTCAGGVLDIAGTIMEEVKLNYKIEKENPLNRIQRKSKKNCINI